MSEHNPYRAPQSDVAVDVGGGVAYQPKIFSTTGRIGRMRYWVFSMLVTLGLYVVFGVGFAAFTVMEEAVLVEGGGQEIGLLAAVLILIAALLSVATMFILAMRRLNDMNKTGWLVLLLLLPVVNLFFTLYLIFGSGTAGSNQYGPQPVPNSTAIKIGFGLSLLVFVGSIVTGMLMPTSGGWYVAPVDSSGF